MNAIVFAAAFLLMLTGCSAGSPSVLPEKHVLRIKGSDSMLLLVERLAEKYMAEFPGRTIETEGGGSRTGIEALIDGTIDLSAMSRPISPDEVQQLAAKYRSIGISIMCAKDALTLFVHVSNPVSSLSQQQVKQIYCGDITRWNVAGGTDAPVTLYRREPNSGTYLYFEEHLLLGEEYSEESRAMPGTRAMINAVAKDSTGIGYSTSAYIQSSQVKALAVDGVLPTPENIRNGTYPVTRYLYFYAVHQPEGAIKHFLDWVVSPAGQKVAKENGYIPLFDPVE